MLYIIFLLKIPYIFFYRSALFFLDKYEKIIVAHENDNFDDVIFSDESYFELFTNTRKVFVLSGEETPHKKMPNPIANEKVLYWGAISKKGKVCLTLIDGTIDKYKY